MTDVRDIIPDTLGGSIKKTAPEDGSRLRTCQVEE
jgi:hypothetical protein